MTFILDDSWGEELERELERCMRDITPDQLKALGKLMDRPIIEPVPLEVN